MNFIEAVNRVLRSEGIIRGDDDEPTDFTSTQHANSINLAQIAIQSELTHLIANDFIPYEEAEATINTVASTRTYSLASDFVRFQDEHTYFLEVDGSGLSLNSRVVEYLGGEEQLRRDVLDYREIEGTAIWWYLVKGTTKKVGFYPVPSAVNNYRYYYQKDIQVTNVSDTVPFVTESEAQVFVQIASRRFKFLRSKKEIREQLFPRGVSRDPVIIESRADLMHLLRGTPPMRRYGRRYASN